MKFPAALSARLCILCSRHPAKFTFRGRVKRDKDHDLCHRCYRSWSDRNHARRIADTHRSPIVVYELSSFFRQALEQPAMRISRSTIRS
jgi:hypothetical protein